MARRIDDGQQHRSILHDRDAGSHLRIVPTLERKHSEEMDLPQHHRRRNSRNKLLAPFYRFRRRQLLRRVLRRQPLALLLTAILALLIATPLLAPSYSQPPPHYEALAQRCSRGSRSGSGHGSSPISGCANPHKEQIFISVSLFDAGGALARGRWGSDLEELIGLLGPENVYLSIYENDSGPEGSAALAALKRRLQCAHEIVNDAHVDVGGGDFPSVTLADGSRRVKRLAYLSEMRNRALRPLDRFITAEDGTGVAAVREFDKVLFMNDIAFRPVDAANLLFSTNIGPDGRAQYLAACPLDYLNPFLFYDPYATRDAEGFSMGLPFFPIFSSAGQGISRRAILEQRDAVPVSSCWSGMVAMQARYLQNLNASLPDPGFQDIGAHVIDPNNPQPVAGPVRFRYEPERYVDACECCLFQADVAQVARQAGGPQLGTYVNPYIRVAYRYDVLAWLPWVRRWERLFTLSHRLLTPLVGLPTQNPHRTVAEGETFIEEIWVGEGSAGHWELVERRGRNGMFCDVREFQAFHEHDGDVNWENLDIPPGQTLHFPT
ncbi:cryptococcal mannosyltransferase 1-domain-containing protein [Xylariomycetidae sp. FL2044]|nr:cryptococcal mannosyltransferase 1-domain-containing protein [Xylariomycetidae sp. FL2044]